MSDIVLVRKEKVLDNNNPSFDPTLHFENHEELKLGELTFHSFKKGPSSEWNGWAGAIRPTENQEPYICYTDYRDTFNHHLDQCAIIIDRAGITVNVFPSEFDYYHRRDLNNDIYWVSDQLYNWQDAGMKDDIPDEKFWQNGLKVKFPALITEKWLRDHGFRVINCQTEWAYTEPIGQLPPPYTDAEYEMID